ncbi:S8 family serine peptidase [Rhizobium ruizarguesonis]|uniref:S8 family serine peptidase n=1 Tax=Rhizobium ruizarguesonis TaxID=2081791 RepID=UPI0013EEBDDC|nr:S8 family serine peptidase [Rhizobium ruizarguesonis]
MLWAYRSRSIVSATFMGTAIALTGQISAFAQTNAVSIRGVAGLDAQAQLTLAASGDPQFVTIENENGQTLRDVIASQCGSPDKEVEDFLAAEAVKLNRLDNAETVVRQGMAVAIPFCLNVRRNVDVTVKAGDTPESLLKENYGVFGPKTVDKFFQLNRIRTGARTVSDFARSLQIGKVLTLPAASEIRIFTQEAPDAPSLEAILEQAVPDPAVKAMLESTIVPAAATPVDPLAGYRFNIVDSVALESAPEACPVAGRFPNFDPKVFSDLYEAQHARSVSVYGILQPGVIGIVDTGLGRVDDLFFRRKYLRPNALELAGEQSGLAGSDDDENGFVDDVYGTNFNARDGDVRPLPDLPDRQAHGTKMAALALGGPQIAGIWLPDGKTPPVMLKIVNFQSSTEIGATVLPYRLADAVDYLAAQDIRVVNLSLSNSQNLEGLSQTIGKHGEMQLFVVAAGNARQGPGRNIDSKPLVFPARYGGRVGDHKRNVLTVAAHDGQGKRAPFSNVSDQFVDLFAPGCSIATRDDNGSPVNDSGTSPAAATVSFTSGLLVSLGLTDPRLVKNRILTSVDFDEDLRTYAWSSGRLNILKAISLWDDVVQTSDGSYRRGKVSDRQALAKFCAEPDKQLELTDIRKIVPNIKTQTGGLQIEYWTMSDRLLSRVRCSQASLPGPFAPMGDDQGPPISEVKDLTFAQLPAGQ